MIFDALFQNIAAPILIYLDEPGANVVYSNHAATSLLGWDLADLDGRRPLTADAMLGMSAEEFQALLQRLAQSGEVSGFGSRIRQGDSKMSAVLSANRFEIDGIAYVKLCIQVAPEMQDAQSHAQALTTALSVAFRAKPSDAAIEDILTFMGRYLGASRAYLFEAHSDSAVSATYEWCAQGMKPRIHLLQNLPRKQQPYDRILSGGIVVTELLPMYCNASAEEAGPPAKAMIFAPVLSVQGALGYVNFEDCLHLRKWSEEEIRLIHGFSELLVALLAKRDGERSLRYSLEVLNTVADNFDYIVYVSDLHTGKVLFANSALAAVTSTPVEELLEQDSSQLLRKLGRNPEDNYPLNLMLGPEGRVLEKTHTWEYHNSLNDKWYLARSAIIKWIDGKDVHLETAAEITNQKRHEAQLELAASTDVMTGVYNRAWGRRLIENLLEHKDVRPACTLVFLDLDGLKGVNDRHGHAVGDQMIIKTVELILSCIRRSDSVCRWGGDEFVMVVRAGEADTARVMKKILAHVAEFNARGGHLFTMSFSFGMVEMNADTEYAVDGLVAEADRRMYQNKLAKCRADSEHGN